MAAETLLAGACGAGVSFGLVGVVVGFRGTTLRPARRPRRARTPLTPIQQRRRRIRWSIATGLGILVWLLSGWVLALPLVMLAILGWPWLMAPTRADHSNIERLEALAEWTTRISASLEFGAGLENAIIKRREGCPEAIETEVAALASRLQAKWDPEDALNEFGAAFADATADQIVAALLIRAKSSGPGLAPALAKHAETVRRQVRQRRRIEADRAAARLTVRWITYLILAVGVGMAFNRNYSAPYATAVGQLVLAVLAGGFIAVLLWMRTITVYRPTPRFLTWDKRSAVRPPKQDGTGGAERTPTPTATLGRTA